MLASTVPSYHAFWHDMQEAVPDWFALIHYNTPRVHRRIEEECPDLLWQG